MIPIAKREFRRGAEIEPPRRALGMELEANVLCQLFGLRDGPPPSIQTKPLPKRVRVRPVWLREVVRKSAFGTPVRYATIRELRKLVFVAPQGNSVIRTHLQQASADDIVVLLWRKARY